MIVCMLVEFQSFSFLFFFFYLLFFISFLLSPPSYPFRSPSSLLGTTMRTLHRLDKCSVTELSPQPSPPKKIFRGQTVLLHELIENRSEDPDGEGAERNRCT